MSNFFFTPYGVLPGEFKDKGLDDKAIMKHWRPEAQLAERLESFQTWQNNQRDIIAKDIWPVYNPVTDTWTGDAVDTAEQLTRFDLEVMIAAFMYPNNILEDQPSGTLCVPLIENHLKHYKYEDEKAPGVNYRQYDRTLESREEELFLYQMKSAITTKSLGVGEKIAGHFWFKQQFQRPRPLHAAIRLNLEKHFRSELSLRGQHPSIVSGHCLQGVMMCCSVLSKWNKGGSGPTADRKNSLAQYMVDIGDRRVFAGVHYPTDNVASWAVAFSLIPEVFQDDKREITTFVREAILKKSRVFEAIKPHIFADERCSGLQSVLSRCGLLESSA